MINIHTLNPNLLKPLKKKPIKVSGAFTDPKKLAQQSKNQVNDALNPKLNKFKKGDKVVKTQTQTTVTKGQYGI